MARQDEHIIVPCDCAGCCSIMRADRFWLGDDADGYAFVEFYSRQGKADLRWRIKNAWSVLRGTDHHSFDCISLSPPDQQRLGEWLTKSVQTGSETKP